MNVGAAGRVPAHAVHRGRRPLADRPSPGTIPVDAPAPTVTNGDDVGTAAGPTTPGGNDTPFTHALQQGSGRKTGIHRRMAEWVAAQQVDAGLGGGVAGTLATDGSGLAAAAPMAGVPSAPDDPAPLEALLEGLDERTIPSVSWPEVELAAPPAVAT